LTFFCIKLSEHVSIANTFKLDGELIMVTRKRGQLTIAIVATVVGLCISGCNKATEPAVDSNPNQDVAESVANSLGETNGGVSDQLGDIADVTGSVGIQAVRGIIAGGPDVIGNLTSSADTVTKTFNASDTSWTINVSRSRVGFFGRMAGFTRTYYIKFIDPSGTAIPAYIINTIPKDTASMIRFRVLSGTGYDITRRMSNHLLTLTSDWIATGTNTSTITVNGSSTRTGVDTIQTVGSLRVLSHTLSLTFINVTSPRVPRFNATASITRATGGTVSGTYSATVSVLRGTSYAERSFSRTFTVTFGNDVGAIDVGGSRFLCNLTYGELSGS
jgi:hypothetical protein